MLSVMFAAAVFGCGKAGKTSYSSQEETEKESAYVSLLNDKNFKRGFKVRGLGLPIYGDAIETFGPLYETDVVFDYEKEQDKAPAWNLAQWASRYPFHDKGNTTDSFNYRFTDEGGGKYLYENRSKTLEADTASGEFRLALKASECFVRGARTEGQEWPHLLLEQEFGKAAKPSSQMRVSNSQSLKVSLDMKLNSFADKMNGEANPGLHSAVCMLYLYVSNLPEGGIGFSDMLWLGLTLFDNRTAYPSGMSGIDGKDSKQSATDKWIYNVPSTNFVWPENNLYDLEGNMQFDKWVSIDVEMLPFIRQALREAQAGGCMKGAKEETLYINAMYIGFECPGTYDVDMSFKNLEIASYIEL